MSGDGSFPVEEFLGAITSQLDRTQDMLALKAVNRPLTYAIKDFEMELKVFVGLDPDGRVTLRSAAPNEAGASAIRIAFTTITRPMIEENTVSLALTRSPSLSEAGIPDDQRQRLERLGVRNTAELARLGSSAGAAGISRLADVPVDRLRQAMTFGRPQVRTVKPLPAKGARPPAPPPGHPPPAAQPPPPAPAPRPPVAAPGAAPSAAPRSAPPRARPPAAQRPLIVPPGTRRIQVGGRNMLAGGQQPVVRLAGTALDLLEADDDRLVVGLPDDAALSGTLEIEHGDGEIESYDLAVEDPYAVDGG